MFHLILMHDVSNDFMCAVASGFSPSTYGFKSERNKSLTFRKFPCVMGAKAMCKHHDNGRKKLLVDKFTTGATALEAAAVLETASAAAALTESTPDPSEASASEKSFQRATTWMRQQEIMED